jgi:hypothetical protein
MGLSARTPTTTKTNLFIPALYSNKTEEAVKDELVAWGAIDTSWQSELVKGDILYITKSNTVTASEVVVGTKATALNPLNTTGVTLTINQWYEAPVDIDYMSIRQRGADPEKVASVEAGHAIKEIIDTSVCTLFSSLGGYSTSAYGSDGQTLTDDILVYLMETLDESNVPRDGNRSLIIDPSGVADMIKIDKFIANQYVNIGAVNNGVIGNSPIYGCTVRVTNNLVAATTGNYACMLHKKAIAGAAQIQNAWTKEYEDLHQRRYSVEALWGVIELNNSFGIPFFSRKS